ncbi:MAG: DUF4340 domain-containing protein [Bdellovibrionales bacterium]|nr:DUF4340 domain-containing protein [Bdellovibrionales bacterium]
MKKRAFPTTGIFIALVMAFATWTYFSEYKGLEKETAEKEKSSAVLPFSNSKVTSFFLKDFDKEAPFNETFVRKDGEQWKLEKPLTDLADPMAVDSFLSSLATQKIKEIVVEAPDIAWATFGLDKPQLEAQFVVTEDGKETTRKIVIGATPAFDGSVYGRIGDENRVVLFESAVEAILMKESRDFRDKRFFPLSKHPEFSTAEFKVNGRKLSFEKKDGNWMIAGSAASSAAAGVWPVDSKKVQTWVETVSGLRAYDIWAEDKTDPIVIRGRRLNQPAFEATLKSDKGEVYTAAVAPLGKEEAVAAATGSARPLVFSLNKNVIESLLKSLDDVRDLKFPFQMANDAKIADIARIEIERPKTRDSLPAFVRDGKTWKIADDAAKEFLARKIKTDSVDGFLKASAELSAVKVVAMNKPAPKLGSKKDEQGFRAKFKTADGKTVLELLVAEGAPGITAGGNFLVASSKTPGAVFEVEKSLVDAIPLELLEPANPSAAATKGTP